MPVMGTGTWSLTYCDEGTWLFTEEIRYMKSGLIPARLVVDRREVHGLGVVHDSVEAP